MVAAMGELQVAVDDFVLKLRRRQVEGSFDTAKQAAELLRQIVSHQRVPAALALMDAVKAAGLRMIKANPMEMAVGNVVRRVLHIIREENVSLETNSVADLSLTVGSDDEDGRVIANTGLSGIALAAANRSALRAPSLHNLLESIPWTAAPEPEPSSSFDVETKSKSSDKNSKSWSLKHNVIEGINELIGEIENYHSQIAEQALEHIHQNEVILTLGHSRTLLHFLREAKKKRSFQVFIAEGAPRYQGHILAKELSSINLQTTVITDSAVFAMISRVNMVIVGAHTVMANGGVIGPVGLRMLALAAHRHAVPFVVLTGLHKLCPLYPHDPLALLSDAKSPSEVLDFEEFSDCLNDMVSGKRMDAINPTFDYIPPEFISLFITDTGGHNPSYIYRLVAEYYSPEDSVLQ